MAASGIGTIEYGKALFPLVEVGYDFAEPVSTFPDYAFLVQKDRPIAYWRADEIGYADIVDFSPFGRTVSLQGLSNPGVLPLTTNGRSILFGATGFGTASITDVLYKDTESKPFSLELWVRPLSAPTMPRLLLGRPGFGIYLVPSGIEFRLGTSTCSYVWDSWEKNHHVVATFGGGKMGLYVDSFMAEQAIFLGSFPNTSNFYLGGNGTGDSIYIDELAIYGSVLNKGVVTSHQDFGKYLPPYQNLVSGLGGIYFGLGDSRDSVALTYSERAANDFFSGTSSNVTIGENYIEFPAGSYRVTDPIDLGEVGITAGSKIDWASTDNAITVQVSFNQGITWTNCINHSSVPGISGNLANKIIQFRQINNTTNTYSSKLSKLKFVVYTSKTFSSANSGLVATGTNNILPAESSYNFVNEYPSLGANLLSSDSVILPMPPLGFRAVDLWVRMNSPYLTFPASYSTAPTTVMINGQVQTAPFNSNFPVGYWVHIALLWNSPYTGNVTISGNNMNVAHVGVYENGLSRENAIYHSIAGTSKAYVAFKDRIPSSIVDYGGIAYLAPTESLITSA